jgi:hypothetical protein
MGWSEEEVKLAIDAYFDLLSLEQNSGTINKAALYRKLSSRTASRSAKAFELKFQNISAVLYEQKLPYCTGLKPKGNYQRLLKLMVLDRIDRTPLPALEPHEILFSKLREISRKDFKVEGKGSGRFGLALEKALGIPANSSKTPDFMGIELKTKVDKSLQTLFSRTPTRFILASDKNDFFRQHHYRDEKRNRNALYTSFNSEGDSLGFKLRMRDQTVVVHRNGREVIEYDAIVLEKALLSKHSRTAFLAINSSRKDGMEYASIRSIQYCEGPSIISFLKLIREGSIFLDFTMSEKPNGAVNDHGFLWRIRGVDLPKLYISHQEFDIGAV